MLRTRLFIDYWNFHIDWQKRTGSAPLDWTQVPSIFIQAANEQFAKVGSERLSLDETRVYASYEPGHSGKLRNWLHNFLDRQPGIRVFATERHWRQRSIHCRECNGEVVNCPSCSKPLGRAGEKTVDARIVTDLVNLAWEGVYDVAVLVTSDKDFKPAVDALQNRNFKVVNGHWRGTGHELATLCWASFEIDHYISPLTRPSGAPANSGGQKNTGSR